MVSKWSSTLRTSVTWIIQFVVSMLTFSMYSRNSNTNRTLLQNKAIYYIGQNKKVLVLDLDETLVHATTKPIKNAAYDMVLDVVLEGISCRFYVKKRPFLDMFLRQVCESFDVVVFTASLRTYADPVIDMIDPKRLIKLRLFRDSCINREGVYIKDLRTICSDLSKIIIIDNSPIAYSWNKENAIPITDWFADNPKDEALLQLLPFLSALRFSSDVRSSLNAHVQRYNPSSSSSSMSYSTLRSSGAGTWRPTYRWKVMRSR